MRIAFVADPTSPNGWYRGVGPMMALVARGHEVRQVVRPGDVIRPHVIEGCDLLHIHRYNDEETLALVRRAKAAGMAVVWDNDDDLASVPKNNPGYRQHGGMRGARSLLAMRRLFQFADLVTTPSTRLAEVFASYGARRVEVIENYVRDEYALAARRPRSGDRVTVGWLAGKEHRVDAELLPVGAMLEGLLARHRHVELFSIGVALGVSGPRCRRLPEVRFHSLETMVAQFDVGIAPLADIPFNRARSNVKLKEYAAVGVPWLASPIGPYAGLGEQQGGRLIADEAWAAALDRIVTDAKDRRKLAKRALKWGRAQTVSQNVTEWEHRFERVVAARR